MQYTGANYIKDILMLNLNDSKLPYHMDRVEQWRLGERIAPLTVDLALSRACDYRCTYCYGNLQKNPGNPWTKEMIVSTFNDFADIGVKAVSLVSDGESTLNKHWVFALEYARTVGLDVALGTNGASKRLFNATRYCTYLRVNFSAATKRNYCKIHGVKPAMYNQVQQNIRRCVEEIRDTQESCSIGMQMVLLPDYAEEILPLTYLAKGLGVDYLQIKHCSDDEKGTLGVDYKAYEEIYPVLEEAESLSDETFQVIVKWNKLRAGNVRSYERCYAPPFHLQISGSGLVAPCGMFFSPEYDNYHIGNLHQSTFKDIWRGERYWSIMNELASDKFNAQTQCGVLCLQDAGNIFLHEHVDLGHKWLDPGTEPQHKNFI